MKTVLLIAPINGNGGIQSWTRKYLQTFPDDDFSFIHVNVSIRRSTLRREKGFFRRFDGLIDLINTRKEVINALKNNNISLMHTTTSGNIGTLRDYILVKACHKYGVPCIMHCRYGCIPEDFIAKGFWGWLLRKTMHLYDNVWVLDRRSENALKTDPLLKDKVFLTPNSIHVPSECDLSPKLYKHIAFVGNLDPNKGLFEVVHAVADNNLDIRLTIAGPGEESVVNEIKSIAGDKFGDKIEYVGKLSNQDAVQLIKSIDILALPSFFKSEAFPISIIEAMSYGKIVIGTRRAAIPDMLTGIDGNECGYLVNEKSIKDIVEAIKWCQNNPKLADDRCAKAYEKVKTCYSTDVIYELYRSLYRKLLVN